MCINKSIWHKTVALLKKGTSAVFHVETHEFGVMAKHEFVINKQKSIALEEYEEQLGLAKGSDEKYSLTEGVSMETFSPKFESITVYFDSGKTNPQKLIKDYVKKGLFLEDPFLKP